MKIKINWGTGILIAIIIFMSFMGALVYRTTMEDNSLVSDDYYEESLRYNEKIEKIENANSLNEQIKISKDADNIYFQFPVFFDFQKLSGTILFYHPSQAAFDKKVSIKTNSENLLVFPLNNLKKGKYIVKIDFNHDGTAYYYEENIFVNMGF